MNKSKDLLAAEEDEHLFDEAEAVDTRNKTTLTAYQNRQKRINDLVYLLFGKSKEGEELLGMLVDDYLLNLAKVPDPSASPSVLWVRSGENKMILKILQIVKTYKNRLINIKE